MEKLIVSCISVISVCDNTTFPRFITCQKINPQNLFTFHSQWIVKLFCSNGDAQNLIRMNFHVSLNQILQLLSILFLNCIDSQHPEMEEEHRMKVPNCGTIPGSPSSRLINVEESKVHYPWMIQVIRYYKEKNIGVCGGSIITKRSPMFVIEYVFIHRLWQYKLIWQSYNIM